MRPLAILLLAAAGIYAAGDAVLAPTPPPEHPGFIDAVLASRAVLAVVRLAIIFAGAFVIGSVVALVARRQWLTKVGPVEVSERVAGAAAEISRLEGELERAGETIGKLRQEQSALKDLVILLSQDRAREESR